MSAIVVHSKAHEQIIDITQEVAAAAASLRDGICGLFVQHTTCALTILTNEEGIAEDFLSPCAMVGSALGNSSASCWWSSKGPVTARSSSV